ncbi:MAG: sulfite exporter TauE/SafE family protein [Acidobacteria bacterium]|nr:sulfite exporter TauE/SafE family protein [Acidobacteriota bacterium]
MTLLQILAISGIGALAGLIGAMFGVGGGILIVPALAVGFGVPMHTAIVTSLLCVIATSSSAASKNIRTGAANVRLAILLEPCTVIGAIAGGFVAGYLPGSTLMKIFGITIIAMSYPMLRGVPDEGASDGENGDAAQGRFRLPGAYFDAAAKSEVTYETRQLPALVGVSTFAGVLSGLLGVGGGILKVPTMAILGRVPMKAAAATSNLMIGITAVASALIYYGRGDVAPALAAACVTGVFVGSRTGVHVAGRIHGHALRRGFAAFMILMGVQLLLKAYGYWFR